jgi:hypothetical protein
MNIDHEITMGANGDMRLHVTEIAIPLYHGGGVVLRGLDDAGKRTKIELLPHSDDDPIEQKADELLELVRRLYPIGNRR